MYLEKIDFEILEKINKEKLIKARIIPVCKEGSKIIILKDNESSIDNKFLNFIFESEIKYIDAKDIDNLIECLWSVEDEMDILKKAIFKNASDIHFDVNKNFVDIRFRVDGKLILIFKISIESYKKILSKIKARNNLDITNKMLPQDGKVIYKIDNEEVSFRISVLPSKYGEKLVMRVMRDKKENIKIEDIYVLKKQIEDIKKIQKSNVGIVIIAGPTGSGKSTTLYKILESHDKNEINITTLEDPIEREIEGVCQVALNEKVGLDFKCGLKSILRQDPDIIMIGEIRDEDTAKMGIRASISGHKVYTTIHARSPREVFFRLEDMGIKRDVIKNSLTGIVSQRLVRVLCKKCKKKVSGEVKKCGCAECNFTGYKGRKVVSSVYYINETIRESLKDIDDDFKILSNKQMLDVIEKYLKDGDITKEDYKNFIESEELYDFERENKK